MFRVDAAGASSSDEDAWSGRPLVCVNTEHVHRDDVPVDINAVIIDNVLNGSEVYGSGRRLARAMLPISGGMCTSSTQLFSTATTTGRCSTRSAPPRPPTHLVATMPRHSSRVITPSSTRARGRNFCSSQLQQGTLTVSLPTTTRHPRRVTDLFRCDVSIPVSWQHPSESLTCDPVPSSSYLY